MSAYEEFQNAGIFGWILLLLFLIGLAVALASIVLLAARQRAAFHLGIVSMLLGALIAAGGAFGTVYARRTVDGVIELVSPVAAERIRRQGYLEAQSIAKFGVRFAFVPLVAGAIAAFTAARRRKAAPPPAPPGPFGPPPAPAEAGDGGGLLLPGMALGFGALALAGAASQLLAPLPGRDWPVDDPRWRLLEATAEVLHGSKLEPPGGEPDLPSDVLRNPCDELESVLEAAGDEKPDLAAAPELPAAIDRCFDDRLGKVAAQKDWVARLDALEKLQGSRLAAGEENRQKVRLAIEQTRAEAAAKPGGGSAGGMSSTVRMGATTVSGRLPPEVIQRIVRQNFGRFRLCYENGLARNPELQGRVAVRFVIGRDGAVSTAASDGKSDLSDPAVVSCVVNAFRGISFPQPEGGIVTVVYPIIFAPGK